MTVKEVIQKRGIKEVLHFTPNQGITGILASNAVKSRKRVSEDKYLEHILKLNCPDRSRDINWHGYVNLSITKVNGYFFRISKDKWHVGSVDWWCILSFSPEVLTHPRIFFCTTNNAYSSVVLRGRGGAGLERLFADEVVEYESGTVSRRRRSMPANEPTCEQAEVLYPGELSLDYLQCIYVNESENAAAIESMFDVCSNHSKIKGVTVIEKPELF